jgi:hypothetical protein
MKRFSTLFTVVSLFVFLSGCGSQSDHSAQAQSSHRDAAPLPDHQPQAVKGSKEAPAENTDDEVQANLAKLSPEDRKLAEAQKYCAVEDENLLGSMDVPVKVMVKDEPVFLCCKGCKKRALAEPDKTIAKVNELKEKSKDPPSK